MSEDPSAGRSLVDWSVAGCPIAGQAVSGDLHLVRSFDHSVLLGAVDGLGHGEEAVVAARTAVALMEKYPHEPVISLLKRCHEALTKTRGVVATLALFDALKNTLTWTGVGNVEGRLVHAGTGKSESALLRSGLVGYNLPELQSEETSVSPGDVLILATDGIRVEFLDGVNLKEPPRQIANNILKQYFKGTDDALVLVARYLGMSNE